jgi:hypothetical protein
MPVIGRRSIDFGTFGGTTLRTFESDGHKFKPGDAVPPEVTAKWPLQNRDALEKAGRISFHTRPAGFEESEAEAAAKLNPNLGEHGAVAMQKITVAGNEFLPGSYFPPKTALAWPVLNRHALAKSGRVAFFSEAPTAEALENLAANDPSLQALMS